MRHCEMSSYVPSLSFRYRSSILFHRTSAQISRDILLLSFQPHYRYLQAISLRCDTMSFYFLHFLVMLSRLIQVVFSIDQDTFSFIFFFFFILCSCADHADDVNWVSRNRHDTLVAALYT